MQTITAGEELTATVLNDWTPQPQTGTATPAASFTVSSFTVYKVAGVTWFSVTLAYSGSTITASSSGTITATQCCTLPFAPQAQMTAPYLAHNNAYDGTVSISTGGLCTLRTLSPSETISSGDSVTFSGVILTG